MKLSESSCVITGGASGLGWAVSQFFIEKGAAVTVLDLPKEENQQRLANFHKNLLFCAADITDSPQIESALQKAVSQFGKVDVLVNCAGIASAIKTLKNGDPCPLKIFTKTIEINLSGTFNMCRLASSVMAKNSGNQDGERGVIINTASIAAYDGQMGQTAYAASKGGIVSLTLPLARDLSSYGIRVVTIAPGIFDTPMLSSLPEAARQSLAKQVPFPKRLGNPMEYAALSQHIIENSMLNGEVIRLDGGLRMGIQ